jgi:hypothetical protein
MSSAAQSGIASRIAQSKNFAAWGTSGLFIRSGPVDNAAPWVSASRGRYDRRLAGTLGADLDAVVTHAVRMLLPG